LRACLNFYKQRFKVDLTAGKPENPAGVCWPCVLKRSDFLDFFGSFLCQDKNEQGVS